MTVAVLLSLFVVAGLISLFDVRGVSHTQSAVATSTATTSVTVLNTPPAWTVSAREQAASATSTPTNSGSAVTWTATGSDSNGENYYFLVCKASSTPTPTAGGAPVCGGGSANQWVVSGSIVSGNAAVVSTTTADAWSEKNDWFGYICDANAGNPRCNATMYNGTHEAGNASATSSPFVVNHRPTFTAFIDNSPTLPGAKVTWYSTSTDPDTLRGTDQVRLFVCKAADFVAATPACGAGGEWSSSTLSNADPYASTTITIPTQDKNFSAYGYVVDQFNHPAVGGSQGTDSTLTVANAAPYVSSSTIRVYDVFGSTTADTNLSLTVEEGQTSNYVIQFDVNDDNSCRADGGGNEIADVDVNVYRSGIGMLGCDALGEYNVNNCYTDRSPLFAPTCYQVPGDSCTANDAVVTWECTFPLWYTADPTDGGSQYAAEDWRASARGTDDDAATGVYSADDRVVDAGGTSQILQFLSFRATGSPIAYGSWEPGQGNPTHTATTTLYATGNTGLNQYLSGDAMCTQYPAACSGNATSTIYVPYQHYSLTSGALYAAGTELSTSTTPTLVDVVIPKTTATSTPTNDDTYWAIFVPSTITYAGDYLGRNYIDAVVAPSGEW